MPPLHASPRNPFSRPAPRARLVGAAAALLSLVATALGMSAVPAAANTAGTQHLGVPAYFSPGQTQYWNEINAASPGNLIIANPSNGPGTAFDSSYASAIQAAANAGQKVIGYVDTGYFGVNGNTTRSGSTSSSAWTSQIEADVSSWYSYYGSYGLSGIFFDDALNDCGTNNAHVNLYSTINSYVKNAHPSATTVDNPGVGADQCYASAADVLVTFEGSYSSYLSYSPPSWEQSYSNPNKFLHLVYSTGSQSQMENAIALSKQRNAGYVYVTNDIYNNPSTDNPWDTLPTGSYWTDELAKAAAGGGGGGGGGCTTVAGSGGITNYSACVSGSNVVYKATFSSSQSFYHVFINSDNNASTGYQLPSGSATPLGADYMIENNTLWKSNSSGWGWDLQSTSPNQSANGLTFTWTIPLSALGSSASTQQAEFNGGTTYSTAVTYTH
ncbi:spherulation-specific family 4 protein [Streptomyces sp. NPDC047028]|uniref:spherulation-specific family 4 protein n=1 Tax=Streptomyces sp. NPDC047028 TaxID=3155793 RepID=UPI00340A7D90